ncbi:MAG: response regulator [Bacteroidales bacterium]|nr:response regulator [Bacteroidales bacterium]
MSKFSKKITLTVICVLSFSTLFLSCRESLNRNDFSEEKNQVDSLARQYQFSIDSLVNLRSQFQQSENKVGEMRVLSYIGKSYREQNKFIEAIEAHNAELDLATELCDTFEMIQALNNLGTNHRRMGILDEATKYHFSALNLCENFSDKDSYKSKKNRVISLNGIGNISLRIGDNETADSVFRQALAGEKELGSALGHAINYANIGAIFEDKNMLDSAWVYYKSSMDKNIEAKSELGISLCYTHFGNLYEKEGKIDEAIKEYEKAYKLEDKIDTWHWLNSCLSLVNTHISKGNYNVAIRLLNKAKNKATEGHSIDHLASIHSLYYEIYNSLGNTAKALEEYRLSDMYNDSVINQQNLISVQNERVKYEYQRRQQEIDAINSEYNKEREIRKIMITSLIVILLLMIVGIVLLFYSLKVKKREQQAMAQLDNVRTSFFTNITHEFRTPLTVIIGLGERLATSDKQDNLVSIGNTIARQGKNLLLLINQILDVAKLKSNTAHKEYRHGNIIGFINVIFEGAIELANRKSINFSFIPHSKSVKMDFIPDHIVKIMSNLISNAIKFTPNNGIVKITTECLNNKLLLIVEDNGCGISKEDLPYIFDAFYQGYSQHRSAGTGIGLSLVKQLVESMNGTIQVESEINSGTKFIITLPLEQVDQKVCNLEENPIVEELFINDGNENSSIESDDSKTRILIVEDNNDISSFIGSVIDNANISYAANGKIGLEKALQIVPDIIITDIMMPEMDGIEMCNQIRESEILSHIPIIIISAKATDADKIEGIKSGVDAYLYKPFNADELNATILSLLERRKTLQMNLSRNYSLVENSNEKMSSTDQAFLNKVIDLIYAQMADLKVNINDIAESLNMTARQLNRKINAITGENASKYVLQVRMTRAKQLLDSNNGYTIAEVAYKCGYEENANFTRAFKSLYNITPTQYRKMPD